MSGKRKFGVSYGWLTGRIHVGRINAKQDAFLAFKEDCTEEALFAVAELVHAKGGGMYIGNGRRKFEIDVTEVDLTAQQPTEVTDMSTSRQLPPPGLVAVLAQVICNERWGGDGETHKPTDWDRRTAEAVLTAINPEEPK